MFDRLTSGFPAQRGLIFGALLIGMITLALFSGEVPDAGAEATVPELPTPIPNEVTVVNNVILPDAMLSAASPQAEATLDVCNQPQPYSDGTLVEAWAGLAYGETRTIDNLPNNNYDWQVTIADSGCANVLITLDRVKLINGAKLKYIFQMDAEGNFEVNLEILARGGGNIYLPISATEPE